MDDRTLTTRDRATARALHRGCALVALLVSTCAPPTASIVSVSVNVVPEQTAQPIVLTTQGCAPSFDVNSGALENAPNDADRLVLGQNAYRIPVHRTGSERFEATLPPTLTPGSYGAELVLADGRRAPYAGQIQVTPVDAQITNVASPFSVVALGQQSVALTVTFANPSGCSIDGVRMTPRFMRDDVDLTPNFTLHGPTTLQLYPMSEGYVVDFTVDVGASAMPGPVQISAEAVDGQRSGNASGCTGPAVIGSVASNVQWTILAPSQQTLVVDGPFLSPHNPHPGDTFQLSLRVTNHGSTAVTMDSIQVQSTPWGVTEVGHLQFVPPRIDASGQATYTLMLTTPPDANPTTTYSLRPVATGTTDDGEVVASSPTLTVDVTLHGR
jgi:hypothetical protein